MYSSKRSLLTVAQVTAIQQYICILPHHSLPQVREMVTAAAATAAITDHTPLNYKHRVDR
jgi:hypothetical protein